MRIYLFYILFINLSNFYKLGTVFFCATVSIRKHINCFTISFWFNILSSIWLMKTFKPRYKNWYTKIIFSIFRYYIALVNLFFDWDIVASIKSAFLITSWKSFLNVFFASVLRPFDCCCFLLNGRVKLKRYFADISDIQKSGCQILYNRRHAPEDVSLLSHNLISSRTLATESKSCHNDYTIMAFAPC